MGIDITENTPPYALAGYFNIFLQWLQLKHPAEKQQRKNFSNWFDKFRYRWTLSLPILWYSVTDYRILR